MEETPVERQNTSQKICVAEAVYRVTLAEQRSQRARKGCLTCVEFQPHDMEISVTFQNTTSEIKTLNQYLVTF